MRRSLYFSCGATLFLGAIAVRIVALPTLPGEWYGDISILYYYVQAILAGQWPVYFQLSAGPLYQYLIAPLMAVLGHTYLTYKLASVLVSLIGLGCMAWLGYLVGGRPLSLATLFVGAFSSWYLIFSRLGNSQILIPVVTALTLGCAILSRREQRLTWVVGGAVVSSAGLYLYPQTFIVPALYLLLLTVFLFLPRPSRPSVRLLLVASLTIAVLSVPFVLIVLAQPENFGSGYVGSKFFGSDPSLAAFLGQFLINVQKTLLMLHIQGDHVFRSNPPYAPQLDPVSGSLFIIGVAAMLRQRAERRMLAILFGSLLILVIPGAWPGVLEIEIPSASRTIGITPIVYLLVARGLVALYGGVAALVRTRRVVPLLVVCLVGTSIVYLNAVRYFVVYADHLPYHNVAFGAIIGQTIDDLPATTQVYVVGCCWADWDLPEKESIQLATRRNDVQFVADASAVCETVDPTHAWQVFFRPDDDALIEALRACAPDGQLETVRSRYGDKIYSVLAVHSSSNVGDAGWYDQVAQQPAD